MVVNFKKRRDVIKVNHKKPFIVGIAGGSGSGKSTFCSVLKEKLSNYKIATIHSDDYYKSVLPKIISPRSGIEYDDYNHPTSVNENKLVHDLNSLIESDIDIILIDSLFTLYYESIREKLDLKIFIDLPSDERLIRRIKRNMQWGLSFDEISDYYLDTVRYRHNEFIEPTRVYADLVVSGNYSEQTLHMIMNCITSYFDFKNVST